MLNCMKSFVHKFHAPMLRDLCVNIWEVTDKSLGRPGRKQPSSTKLFIYSKYSPRNSIHFLARCSKFSKPLKKFRYFSVQPVSKAAMTSANDEKWYFSFFLSVLGKGVTPTELNPENRVGDPDTGRPGRPFSSRLQLTCEPGIFFLSY